jgi:hypothetical protein
MLALLALSVVPAALAAVGDLSTSTSVALDFASWRYSACAGASAPVGWATAAFDASAWAVGAAPLGVGAPGIATVLPTVDTDPLKPGETRPLTSLFRATFSVRRRGRQFASPTFRSHALCASGGAGCGCITHCLRRRPRVRGRRCDRVLERRGR